MPAPADARYVLAVDLGTGGPKVGLVSTRGALAASEHLAVATRRLPGGGAVQDAGHWWDAVRDAARRVLGSGAVDPARVVAEGVETEAELEAIGAMGCDEAQGFLLGRPAPAHSFNPRRSVLSTG